MYRVKYLDELGDGEEVWVYGDPFSPFVIPLNPLKVVRSGEDKVYKSIQFVAPCGIRQVCSSVRKDTYIFRRKPTPAELLAMYLDGIDIGERRK